MQGSSKELVDLWRQSAMLHELTAEEVSSLINDFLDLFHIKW
jgi:hypothetical protein